MSLQTLRAGWCDVTIDNVPDVRDNRPMNVTHALMSSGGNDSVALIAWKAAECERTGVDPATCLVLHNDTGFASHSWAARQAAVEQYARECGFQTATTRSKGMVQVILDHRGLPPQNGRVFCSWELKIEPTQDYLDELDPECELVVLIGKRRAESRARLTTPSWIEGAVDAGLAGPDDWRDLPLDQQALARGSRRSRHHPLVTLSADERDALLPDKFPSFAQACLAVGEPVPDGPGTPELWDKIDAWCAATGRVRPYRYRSRECAKCVPHANKGDLASLDDEDVLMIEHAEKTIRLRYPGFTWRSPRKSGGARTIRELREWGRSDAGGYRVEQQSFCDMGWCDVD